MIAQSPAPVTACTRCRRCGRVLTNPKAIARGMGVVCARKNAAALVAWVGRVEEAPAPADEVPSLVAIAQVLAAAPVELPAHTRRSRDVAGLVLEFDGAGLLTFRFGTWFTTYAVAAGEAIAVDCSDRGEAPYHVYRTAGRVAQAYAAKLAGKAVA